MYTGDGDTYCILEGDGNISKEQTPNNRGNGKCKMEAAAAYVGFNGPVLRGRFTLRALLTRSDPSTPTLATAGTRRRPWALHLSPNRSVIARIERGFQSKKR